MTGPGVGTLTRTAAITMVDVRHVLWRIQTDLRVLRAQHAMITAELESAIAEDIAAFLYRNFINQVEFRFVDRVARTASWRTRYVFTRERTGSRDEDAGGLQYQDLKNTDFSVVVTYSANWYALPVAEKEAFKSATLKCAWGPAGAVSDGAGYWTSDRTYGSGGLGASRSVFRAY